MIINESNNLREAQKYSYAVADSHNGNAKYFNDSSQAIETYIKYKSKGILPAIHALKRSDANRLVQRARDNFDQAWMRVNRILDRVIAAYIKAVQEGKTYGFVEVPKSDPLYDDQVGVFPIG